MWLFRALLIVIAFSVPAWADHEPTFVPGVKDTANQLQLYLDYAAV